jgi:transcription antitermination factor NusG
MPGTRTPFPVPDREIEWLRHNIPERPERGWEESFHKGQRVRITAGPMEGMVGAICSLDRRGLAKLDVENRFGPSVPCIVEIAHVEPVNAQAQPPAGLNGKSSRLKASAGA